MTSQLVTTTFLKALGDCQSLDHHHNKASPIPCGVIDALVEIQKQSQQLPQMLENHKQEVDLAFHSILDYVKTIDNWRISSSTCGLGLGLRDHCNILMFLLSLHKPDRFKYLFGNFNTPAKICDFLKQIKNIDLNLILDQTNKSSALSPIQLIP